VVEVLSKSLLGLARASGRMGAAWIVRERMRAVRARRQGFALGVASGVGVGYLLDPDRGRQRRDRLVAVARRAVRMEVRRGRATALQSVGRAKGAVHHMHPGEPGEPLDDVGLAHKVESVLFRDTSVPKGAISINAEDGTVFLRGQVASREQVEHAVEVAGKIPGVARVENLLHLPGTDAPHPHAGTCM
jgi:osmotically-inducible protein OsmY